MYIILQETEKYNQYFKLSNKNTPVLDCPVTESKLTLLATQQANDS